MSSQNLAPTLVTTSPEIATNTQRSRYVVEDLIKQSLHEILVIGFEVSDSSVIRLLGEAAARGVSVSVFVDEGQQSIRDLRRELQKESGPMEIWEGARLRGSGRKYRLHAKMLIVDAKTALVTSANLTRSGLDSNVEIGVLVSGDTAYSARDFIGLIMDQKLVKRSAVLPLS